MRGMIRRSFLTLTALSIFALTFFGIAQAADVKLRYAHVGSEGDIQHWYGAEFAKRVPDWT